MAGRIARRMPPVKGSDRILGAVRGRQPVTGDIRGVLTNGLHFDFEDSDDFALTALVHLQYVPPSLAPVLEAALAPGSCFYDVGANIGIYSLWAARLVGDGGEVHAFEPVPSTRSLLSRFVAQNVGKLTAPVTVVPSAVGASAGQSYIDVRPAESALAHITSGDTAAAVRVDATTLDDYFAGQSVAGHRPPDLVKIDVEGYELEVLKGGRRLWASQPMIVLEVIPAHLARNGSSSADLYRLLGEAGYEVHDLTPRGLRPSTPSGHTANVLALSPGHPDHDAVVIRLRHTRFARNQTI